MKSAHDDTIQSPRSSSREGAGTTQEEIEAVLASGDPVLAKQGRSCMRKIVQVDEVRQGNRYSHKTVDVYHVVEGDVIVVITVYFFFGGWES